ncbi:hypothetical protein GO599_07155 [Sulfolobus islandicus]|nr:hypothetical protein GO599_07155 [Sulfolobus islandicus]
MGKITMSSSLLFLLIIALFPNAFVEYSLHIQVNYHALTDVASCFIAEACQR